jgi:hypothetical protein
MKYKIAALLVLAVFLGFLADRALVKYTPLPCNNNVSSPANSTCAENNNDNKTEDDASITYKTFSSPKVNFTFEYPDTWVYEEENIENTNIWTFTGDAIFEVHSPPYEVFDSCSVGYKGAKTSYQINTFPTNDPETFVTYEQCGSENENGYIYWQKGEYFANASLINDIHKINLIIFDFGTKNKKYLDIIQHIVQSIKIK